MKKVAILVPESSVMQAIADPQYLFSAVNMFYQQSGRKPLFEVKLIGMTPQVKLAGGAYSVHVDLLITDFYQADLVFVPALFGDLPKAVELNQPMVPWLQDQYNNGAELASLCVGAFLLASTGLLDGQQCSTHWGFQMQFRQMFPQVEVVEGSIVTVGNRLCSSGGANSYWNLMLYLVEKYTDRETAILAAKYFAIDIDRVSQAAFAMFRGQKGHGDAEVERVQEHIEANFQDRLAADELAELVAVGKRSLERRFKRATGNTLMEYIHRVKVEAAKRSLETSRKNVSEVMMDVGYTDNKAFRDLFKRLAGLTPNEYRTKYNRLAG
jgi:transcriptional regulator GlxA family with amidase domain